MKEYFSFTRGERVGIFVISILLFLLICINILIGIIPFKRKTDFTHLQQVIAEVEANSVPGLNNTKSLFSFNPNTIDSEGLDSLDFPFYIKRNILKYREAGGKFRSSDDLRKIYGMNDSLFAIIRDFIDLPPSNLPLTTKPDRKGNHLSEPEVRSSEKGDINQAEKMSAVSVTRIDLNSADSSGLVNINGIGPVYASRILKYRDLLGGYHAVAQLQEIYGMKPETYVQINGYFFADTMKIRKLRINFSDFRELVRHPYLNKEQVNVILKNRSKKGPYNQLSELIELNLLDSVTYFKISHYLTCN